MSSSPYDIFLGDAEAAQLESVSRRASAPFRLVLRARIVMLAAAGTANRAIAGNLGICEDTARKWRRRYCEQGIEGLADAPRSGRPRVFPAGVVAGVQARMRVHLPLPPGPGRAMRAESEYHRFGTLAYLAAYDVHRAQVTGRCEPTTGSSRSPRSWTK